MLDNYKGSSVDNDFSKSCSVAAGSLVDDRGLPDVDGKSSAK